MAARRSVAEQLSTGLCSSAILRLLLVLCLPLQRRTKHSCRGRRVGSRILRSRGSALRLGHGREHLMLRSSTSLAAMLRLPGMLLRLR